MLTLFWYELVMHSMIYSFNVQCDIFLTKKRQNDIRYGDQFHPTLLVICFVSRTGGRLNKKDGLTRYGDSHVKDKTS